MPNEEMSGPQQQPGIIDSDSIPGLNSIQASGEAITPTGPIIDAVPGVEHSETTPAPVKPGDRIVLENYSGRQDVLGHPTNMFSGPQEPVAPREVIDRVKENL